MLLLVTFSIHLLNRPPRYLPTHAPLPNKDRWLVKTFGFGFEKTHKSTDLGAHLPARTWGSDRTKSLPPLRPCPSDSFWEDPLANFQDCFSSLRQEETHFSSLFFFFFFNNWTISIDSSLFSKAHLLQKSPPPVLPNKQTSTAICTVKWKFYMEPRLQ